MSFKYLVVASLFSSASLFAVQEAEAPSGPGYIAHIKTKSGDVNEFNKIKNKYTPPAGFKVILVSGEEVKAEHKKAGYPETDLIGYYLDDGHKVTYVVVDAKSNISWKETTEMYKKVQQSK